MRVYLMDVIVPACGRKKRGDVFDEVEAADSAYSLIEGGFVGELQVAEPVVEAVPETVVIQNEPPVNDESKGSEAEVQVSGVIDEATIPKAKEILAKGKRRIGDLANDLGVTEAQLEPHLTIENGFLKNQGWFGLKPAEA